MVATLAGPAGLSAALDTVQWAADETRLILVHPSFAPWVVEQKDIWILGGSASTFVAAAIAWYKDTNNIEWLPAVKWAPAELTLTASATTGSVTLTASADHFTNDPPPPAGGVPFGDRIARAAAARWSATRSSGARPPSAS